MYKLITTKHRGVFMGRVVDESKLPAEITLAEAQMAVRFWDGKGVFALAEDGPDNCRITKPLSKTQRFWDITSVTECTDIAVEKWKQCPWK